MTPDLVVLGNLVVDDVVLSDGRTRMSEPGGAPLYASLGAALWGVRAGVVSWRGDDYPAWALEAMAARGVDLLGVEDLGCPGVRNWLLYEGRRRRVVHHLGRPSLAEASPTAARIPSAWSGAGAFHIAPMPFEIQRRLVDALSSRHGTLLSLDPYLPLRGDTLEAWREPIARVDAFLVSEDEIEVEGARDPRALLRSLAGGRLRIAALKLGPRGGLLYDAREGRFLEWDARAERVVDSTGAGDAFAAGLIAGRLRGDPLETAVRRGVVTASFALEGWGPAGILAATRADADARLRQWSGA